MIFVCWVKSGIRVFPSITRSSGRSSPAISRRVGKISKLLVGSVISIPLGRWEGQETTVGTRIPPSHELDLPNKVDIMKSYELWPGEGVM